MCKALLEIMEWEINKIVEVEVEKRVEVEVKRERILVTIEILKEIGKDEDEIKKMLMHKYNLQEAEIELYLERNGTNAAAGASGTARMESKA